MTIAEFQKHLIRQGCKYEPLEGTNITGAALILKNPAKNKRTVLNIYKGGELTDKTVMDTCDLLYIKYPPHLEHLAKGKIV